MAKAAGDDGDSDGMSGKVCLVTGATSGIGKVTALVLAAQGSTVIVGGRSPQKAEAAVRQIRSESGNRSVDFVLADFGDLRQVRRMAADVKDRYARLDVLVNNAGAFFMRRWATDEGVEKNMLVNHLAPFLLTNELLEMLQGSAPARIINVSSDVHRSGIIKFDDLGLSQGYSGMKAYAQSKLANVLFTYELARRLPADQVTANAVHPGLVATNIWQADMPVIGPVMRWVMRLFALTPEAGADNSIYLASSAEVAGVTGKYYVKREAVESSPLSYDEEVGSRLWEMSEALTS